MRLENLLIYTCVTMSYKKGVIFKKRVYLIKQTINTHDENLKHCTLKNYTNFNKKRNTFMLLTNIQL